MREAAVLLLCLMTLPAFAAPSFRRDDDAGFRLRGRKLAGLAAGDLDGDGCPELIGLSTQFAIDGGPGGRLLRSTCAPGDSFTDVTTARAPSFPFDLTERSVVIGDLDGDGWNDVVRVGNTWLHVDRNEGPAAAVPFRLSPFPGFPFRPDAGTGSMAVRLFNVEGAGLLDADADGDLDVVLDNAGKLELWVNDGGGGLSRTPLSGRPIVEPTNAEYLSVADLDDDGDVDLAVRVEGGPDVYLNLGRGDFVSTLDVVVEGSNKGDFNLCDLDNDGALDLVVTDAADRGANAVWRQLSPGVFVPGPSLLPSTPSVGASACGDLDGDGWEDLVFGVEDDPDGGSLADAVFINQRDGGFSQLPVPGLGAGPTMAVLLHDADRDGDLDVLLHHEPFSELWRNEDGPQSTLLVRALHAQAARPRDALGASAVLQRCDGTRLSGRRHVSGGTGRGTFPEPVMRFGLGTISEPVVVVRVRFVGGRLVRRAVTLAATRAVTLVDTDADDLSACPALPADGGLDAGVETDAGLSADGGLDGGAADGGLPPDAGSPTDAGAAAPFEVVALCNQRFTFLVGDGQRPVSVTARDGGLPAGLEVDPASGRLTWFPTPAAEGTWPLLVDDGRSSRAIDLRVECTPRDDEVRCGCTSAAPAVLAGVALVLHRRRRRRARADSVPSSPP